MTGIDSFFYQVGGSLPATSPTYIVRQADRDLLEALVAKEYCYILNARQMGKSSLRVRTMSLLKAKGIVCTEIELSGIGSQQITRQQWYGGIVREIIDGFELKVDRRDWWRQREDLSPVQRLAEFIETILLEQVDSEIVIFVDEIDSILSLDFPTDDFIGLIHYFYNKRAIKPKFRRLTFALLGVATPRELMRDRRATPFNIGRAIAIQGFELDECVSLTRGFADRSDPAQIVARILFWTGGQPFLTQKLCSLVKQHSSVDSVEGVDLLVATDIVGNWETQDDPEHLRTIRDRLCRYANRGLSQHDGKASQKLLKLYRRIRKRGKIRYQNCQEHWELLLSGIVALEGGDLIVKNQIYWRVFDLPWIESQLGELNPSPKSALGLSRAVLISLAIASTIIGIRSWGWLELGELRLFDLMMRYRAVEQPDRRLLIIALDREDVLAQPPAERGAASISDRSLVELLSKLEGSAAKAIGLDIYRELPLVATDRSSRPKIQKIRQSDRIYGICQYGNPGVATSTEAIVRDGFNNVLADTDRVIRRQIIAVDDAAPCSSNYSFNWLLAARYFQDLQIPETITEGNLTLGERQFIPLNPDIGGYHQLDNRGHQIMLNCRQTDRIAPQVNLSEVLREDFDLERVRDRIVLIGTIDPSFNDRRWQTACSQETTGVAIQAQMVSQLLSATLDRRPLIWSSAKTIEILTILGCSLIPSLLYYYQYSYWRWGSAIAIVLISCTGEIVLITLGLWLPILPAWLVIVLVSSSLWYYGDYLVIARRS